MGKFYFINTYINEKGNREIHSINCKGLPPRSKRESLGFFHTKEELINYLDENSYSKYEFCKYCCE